MNCQHIAFFLSELHGGGAQRVIVNLANEFAKKGLAVDLVLAKAEGPYLNIVVDRVRIVDLKVSKLVHSFFPLVDYLNEYQPKLLISSLSGANLIAIGAKYIAKTKVKTMVMIQNDVSQQAKNYTYNRRKLLPYLRRYLYPQADLIVAASQGVAKSIAVATKISPKRVEVIYNPVVTPEITKMAQASVAIPELDNLEVPIVLGVGRLHQQKDFTNLIKAFAIVRKQQPAYLVILGEGKERQMLEDLVKDLGLEADVLLPGFVDNPYAYMAKASVFVLSSAWEGFGNVLVEAMACGTTVVSTDCPSGPGEILAEEQYGKLVPVRDSPALAKAILESLAQPSNPARLRSRADEFSVEQISNQYLDFINNSPLFA
ncbi:Glycosyl transferase group 1 [Hyella patelloides LEGE 07179]|uniref:Glycosyl transferase group 1 n=1 Tax=Hyella patelloides LEGE 07179 TaxID=945734 RepID=A0A563VPM9_9CYAN|nr:glycosyltransferase [Hyella patelloides]VEP13237.1 Glycosyl transferase group 1 [Hyella patelloides LEGE 07179]